MDKNKSLFHAPKVILVDKKWVLPTKLIFFSISGYFIYKVYGAIEHGYFYGTRQYHYLAEQPIFFWVMLLLFSIASLVFVWQAFKVKPKHNKKINKDT